MLTLKPDLFNELFLLLAPIGISYAELGIVFRLVVCPSVCLSLCLSVYVQAKKNWKTADAKLL